MGGDPSRVRILPHLRPLHVKLVQCTWFKQMSEDLEGDWEVTIGREVGRRVETSRKAEFEVKLDGKSCIF